MKKFILFAILLQAICFNKAFAQIGIGNEGCQQNCDE